MPLGSLLIVFGPSLHTVPLSSAGRNRNGLGKEEWKGNVSEAGCVEFDRSLEIWKIVSAIS